MNLKQLLEDWIGEELSGFEPGSEIEAVLNTLKIQMRQDLPSLLAKIEQHVLEARRTELLNYLNDAPLHPPTYVKKRIARLDALLNTKGGSK